MEKTVFSALTIGQKFKLINESRGTVYTKTKEFKVPDSYQPLNVAYDNDSSERISFGFFRNETVVYLI